MAAAALKAARGLNRDFGEVEQLQVSVKGPGEFVSTADLRAERTLKAELGRARPLRVSARRQLGEALIGTGFPFGNRGDYPSYLAAMSRVMAATCGVRRLGAAALDLAYVAAGRYDGSWETALLPWDIAAGLLL